MTESQVPAAADERKASSAQHHTFEATVVWTGGRAGRLAAPGNPPLPVAAPPQFGGPTGVWSPEQLLVASVASCLMSTFVYFAERFKVQLASYSSSARATVEQTPQGLRFTAIEVAITVTVPDEEALRKASSLRLKEKLEKYCPVSAAVGCPVRLRLELRSADTARAAGDTEARAADARRDRDQAGETP